MRILLTARECPPYPLARRLLFPLYQALQQAGYSPFFLCAGNDRFNNERFRTLNCAFFHVPPCDIAPLRPMVNTIIARVLARALRRHPALKAADSVICLDATMVNLMRAAMPRMPILYLPLRDETQYARLMKRAPSHNEQENALGSCSKAVALSASLLRQLSASYGQTARQVLIRYPGCDIRCDQSDALRARDGQREWIFMGSLDQENNLPMLLTAFARLPHDFPMLRVVTDVASRRALAKPCERLGLGRRVLFSAESSDITPLLLRAELLILPASYAPFCFELIEAFTCGVPVLAFADAPGQVMTAANEFITHNRTGYLCKAYTQDALVAALRMAAYTSPEKQADMRLECRNMVHDAFCWNLFACEMAQLLREAAQDSQNNDEEEPI